MNEKGKVLAVLGLFIALSSYVLNAVFMMFANTYIPEGPTPHSNPPIVATFWLFFVPVGFILFALSFVFEIKDRYRRRDTNEIWN